MTAPAVRPARRPRDESQAIRAWARENGHEVSERGRLSTKLLEAYQAYKKTVA